MTNKYVFKEENKYKNQRTKNFRKAFITLVLVVVSGVTLFLEACFSPQQSSDDVAIETSTPYSVTTVVSAATPDPTKAPTPSPTPTPTAEPTPSPTPIPLDEKFEMMLAPKGERENGRYLMNQMLFVHFKSGDKESITFFLVFIITDKSDNVLKTFMVNVTDLNTIYYYPKNIMSNYGPNGVDYFSNATPSSPGYLDKPFEVIHVGAIPEYESYLKSLGIKVPETKYSEKMNDLNYGGGFRSVEYAEYLAMTLPDNLCVFHADSLGQNEYSSPVPTK